jgi:hypothetical protein
MHILKKIAQEEEKLIRTIRKGIETKGRDISLTLEKKRKTDNDSFHH